MRRYVDSECIVYFTIRLLHIFGSVKTIFGGYSKHLLHELKLNEHNIARFLFLYVGPGGMLQGCYYHSWS